MPPNSAYALLDCPAISRYWIYNHGVDCEERDRLMNLYLAAAYKNEEASRTAVDMKIKTWLEATKEARRAHEEALEALKQHQAEHGC